MNLQILKIPIEENTIYLKLQIFLILKPHYRLKIIIVLPVLGENQKNKVYFKIILLEVVLKLFILI
jgi:hypothetical protein